MQKLPERPFINRYTLNINELRECSLFANTNPYDDDLKQAYSNSRYTFIDENGIRRSGDTMRFSEQELQAYEEYEIEQKHAKHACKNIIRFFTTVNDSPADIYGNDQNKLKEFAEEMKDYSQIRDDKNIADKIHGKIFSIDYEPDVYAPIYQILFDLLNPLDTSKIINALLDTPVKTASSFLSGESNEMMRAARNFQEMSGNYISPSFQYTGLLKDIVYIGPKIGEIQTRQDGTIEYFNSFYTIYLRGYDVSGLNTNEEREEYKKYLHETYSNKLYDEENIQEFFYNPIKYCDYYNGACHTDNNFDTYYEKSSNPRPNDPIYIGIDIEFLYK